MAKGRVAKLHIIFKVRRRGKAAGYRAYVNGRYLSYHKTELSAKAAIAKAVAVASKGLGSTPRHAPVLFKFVVPSLGQDGKWRYHGKVHQAGLDTKVYTGLSTDQRTVARQVAKAMGHEGIFVVVRTANTDR